MASQQQVQAFLEARTQSHSNPDVYASARRELLASEQADVIALFQERLQAGDEEERCQAIVGLIQLYGAEATGTLLQWIDDASPTVRFVVCSCLHDHGDDRAIPALLDRMKNDPDCQLRGIAASALGKIGPVEVLPHLHLAFQSDHEVDELGYSTSDQAEEAMTSILMTWVSRQVAGAPPKCFREATSTGQLSGTITAEAIPFDPEGRTNRTARYSHLPFSAFGPGCSAKLGLQTNLIDPFEVQVVYVDPDCALARIFIYRRIDNSTQFDWDVHTILDPMAMKTPPKPGRN